MNVAILMSTYNGGKYLEEQLDSLLNQTYKKIKIYIRDDGSSDNTLKILSKYEKKYQNIKVFKGSNLGYCNSFMELLLNCPRADLYAFCDQDDYWHNNKVESAVNMFKKFDKNKPILYYSEANIVDEKLNFLYKNNYTGIDTLGSSFNTTPVIGCTSVINDCLRQTLLINDKPEKYVSHDLYLYRFCLLMDGIILHDHNAYISYRQHGNNTVGTTNSIFKKLKTYKKFDGTRYYMAKIFLELYQDLMSNKNKDIIETIANLYNHKIINKLKIIFDRRFKSKKIKSDLKFIYDVILNKI